jgi:hypothetical protein
MCFDGRCLGDKSNFDIERSRFLPMIILMMMTTMMMMAMWLSLTLSGLQGYRVDLELVWVAAICCYVVDTFNLCHIYSSYMRVDEFFLLLEKHN